MHQHSSRLAYQMGVLIFKRNLIANLKVVPLAWEYGMILSIREGSRLLVHVSSHATLMAVEHHHAL